MRANVISGYSLLCYNRIQIDIETNDYLVTNSAKTPTTSLRDDCDTTKNKQTTTQNETKCS